jgi:hypothetical protein
MTEIKKFFHRDSNLDNKKIKKQICKNKNKYTKVGFFYDKVKNMRKMEGRRRKQQLTKKYIQIKT